MPRAGSMLALALVCLAWPSRESAADPIRVLVIAGSTSIVSEAETAFVTQHGRGLLEVRSVGPDVAPEQLAGMDVVFVYYVPNDTVQRLAVALDDARARGAVVLGAPRTSLAQYVSFQLDRELNDQAEVYWQYGGAENVAAFLALMYSAAGGTRDIPRAAPKAQITKGIYHPLAVGSEGMRQFASLPGYLSWYRTTGLVSTSAPLVGITFHADNIRFRDLAHIDALVRALEREGLGVVPVFGWPLSDVEAYLTLDGASPLRLLLALNLTILRQDDVTLLERLGVRVLNLLITRDSERAWTDGTKGLPPDRISSYLNVPERAGATEPVLIATTGPDTNATTMRPVNERIDAVASRVKRWIALQNLPNGNKRIVMLYYNNPPGAGNVGASYLRIFPTIVGLLKQIREAGYATGDTLPDERRLIDLLERSGRNVELWAPGELEALVRDGHATLVPMDTYRRWFSELPELFRDAVLREWGPPEQTRLMVYTAPAGQKFFVVPGVTFGNLFIGPQPLRTTFERALETAHDRVTPVPHAYVAAYLWYRHTFAADAIVHIGRHGTLEWLPGKQVAQAGSDHSEVLLGDLPNPYFYIMDGGGEAIQAKRRGAAVLISHLTPLIVSGGPQAEFDPLHQALDQLERVEDASPELAKEYQEQVIEDLRRLKLDRQLGLDLETTPWPEIRAAAHAFAHSVANAPIPAGIHSIGEPPRHDVQREALAEVIKFAFPQEDWPSFASELDVWADAIAQGDVPHVRGEYEAAFRDRLEATLTTARNWLDTLRESPSKEIDALIHVLDGRYLPTGLLGDPLRVPTALPTGRNLHAFDGALIPTRAAWALGRKMADQTLARFLKDSGKYPEKVALSLWYGETERHQGAMEAMALHLLGVEPIWNPRGVVDELRLIPDEQMSHPRVDVVFTITGIYRDGFSDKVLLLDRAVRLAASAGQNAVSRHDREVSDALAARGVARAQAERVARARVFGNSPGHYGLGVERMVDQGANAGRDDELAGLFLHNMNFAFSSEVWGETTPDALGTHLQGNESVIFSRSSNLYGALDNEDTYAYVGGLNLATRVINGRAPQFYIHNLRKPGAESMTNMQTWLAYELNARVWNPKWLDEMIRSGYAGAREMSQELEHLYGFQATAPEQVDGTFWQESFDVFVADKHGLRLDAFFATENPHAQQRLFARLIEVDRQGAYRFSDGERQMLVEKYVRGVIRHGFSCAALTCGSTTLHDYVLERAALVPGLGSRDLHTFRRAVAGAKQPRAQNTRIHSDAAGRSKTTGPSRPIQETGPPGNATPGTFVSGFVMRDPAKRPSGEVRSGDATRIAFVYVLVIIGLIGAGALRELRT